MMSWDGTCLMVETLRAELTDVLGGVIMPSWLLELSVMMLAAGVNLMVHSVTLLVVSLFD